MVIFRCYVSNVVGASHWFRNNGGIEVRWKLVCSISTPPQSQFLKHRTSAKTMTDQEERLDAGKGDTYDEETRRVRLFMLLMRVFAREGQVFDPRFYIRTIVFFTCVVPTLVDPQRNTFCWTCATWVDWCPCPDPWQAPPPSPPQSFWDSIPEQLLNGPPSSDDEDTAE